MKIVELTEAQVEALFFGQAGLLSADAIPAAHRDAARVDPYFQELSREYNFLAHKFSLRPVSTSLWRFARMRPGSSPFVRMAQLSMLYYRNSFTVSSLTDAADMASISALLQTGTSSYWDTHFSFGTPPTSPRPKRLGVQTIRLLLINTVAPFLFAYGHHLGSEAVQEKAIALLEELPAEDNFIIRSWRDCGLSVANAADNQALIHLKRLYCERKDCLRCRIGYQYLKKS